ncbi:MULTISPECIES: phosphate ABC transporter substrate-binding protein PstS [unclassified Actinomyces]|uniref:phosphate ABC transporter substrate-binding protein PstS n=1 Tax=unclassified Actinomyces TaxID=2609248 RepID=UPI0020175E35|nr:MULTISPECIES: phosphate ABC transporter substrate-binding protein PstS [unclassified Actinomyces]MCL3777727.1 phosphate ABC transporter substrate-binding protein PstS [Actinomyces sp. AC-20-1]MCL3790658.1 phosphate ABC transporter substrate-binding protein PstS [Actinomyces sp. 187325]MCL3792974.1 phosphate ABC transporter substrate-binding protein PstS [Actinomyces sp. 186855]MCL3794498.1 phosphate ABC transporter substrate-binding protein PstS [Actinomyces sp. 217892]
MLLTRRSAVSALCVTSLAALTACGSDAGGSPSTSGEGSGGTGSSLTGRIKGAGASSQGDAQDAWMNTFMDAHPGTSVEYAAEGSGAGREKLIQGAVDFAGSDSAMSAEELAQAGEVIEVPLYISPIAVVYNVPGLTGDTHLNMTPETVAKVFKGEITRWNDAAIAADNAGADLPDLAIVVVHRSDESGTTKNFTRYLGKAAGDVWTYEAGETWPVDGGQSGDGTAGMIATVEGAEGAIGYADASKVTDALGTVAIGSNGAFSPYSAQAAAATLDASELADDATSTRIVYSVNYEADNTYPIILVSYLIARTAYDDPDVAATVKAYLEHMASPEGQATAAEAAGCAPISDALREKVLAAIATIA